MVNLFERALLSNPLVAESRGWPVTIGSEGEGLMIQKQGTDATVIFQPQTTTDLAAQPFTNNGTPVTNTIPMPGNKGFLRINAKP